VRNRHSAAADPKNHSEALSLPAIVGPTQLVLPLQREATGLAGRVILSEEGDVTSKSVPDSDLKPLEFGPHHPQPIAQKNRTISALIRPLKLDHARRLMVLT
jgi:hypothetical protein